jgi:flavorubredoxin
MPKLLVLYYSRTGNTEKMAKAVAEGAHMVTGMNVTLTYNAKPEELADFDAVILGMPTYHHDISQDMKKLLEEAATKGIKLKGKAGVAFGSYGWSGEAPKLLLEIMKNRFEMKIVEPPLLVKYAPDEKSLEECKKLGRKVAESLFSKSLNF